MRIQKTCCVTGHREIPNEKWDNMEHRLRQAVAQAIEEGYTRFLSGFAQGVDLLFASLVAEQKQQRPGLILEAVLPHAGRLKARDEQFQRLLRVCDGIHLQRLDYAPGCPLQRNRYMVMQSELLLAVYDGRQEGGALYTIRYAHRQEREVRLIWI